MVALQVDPTLHIQIHLLLEMFVSAAAVTKNSSEKKLCSPAFDQSKRKPKSFFSFFFLCFLQLKSGLPLWTSSLSAGNNKAWRPGGCGRRHDLTEAHIIILIKANRFGDYTELRLNLFSINVSYTIQKTKQNILCFVRTSHFFVRFKRCGCVRQTTTLFIVNSKNKKKTKTTELNVLVLNMQFWTKQNCSWRQKGWFLSSNLSQLQMGVGKHAKHTVFLKKRACCELKEGSDPSVMHFNTPGQQFTLTSFLPA